MPAYNEEENIQSTLSGWYEVIEKLEAKNNSGNKLVIINDGSKDKTLEKLKAFKKNRPLLEIIDKKNKGHGPSLIRDYNYAIDEGTDWIFQTDSDSESNFKDHEYPLVTSSAAGFDKSSVYKPTVHYDEESDRLYLWYNGRNQSLETIGFVKIENFKKTAEKLGL